MEKTKILQDILVLLKAAKSHPKQFQQLLKDDMPHPANSPEDKAHDVKEEDESLKQALELLNTPEKRSKMLEHLRSLQDESDLRSPENQEVGQEPMKKQSNPLFASEKTKKEETKHDRCVEEVSKDPKIKNPHAVCVAAGVEPEKWKKGDKDMNKTEKSALDMAKELLKMAQEKPEQFEELTKALAPAAAPMPKPSMPKPKMAAPKPPKMQAPGMMKEEKEESKEDKSKEHEEKESKEHEEKEKEMEKADKKMEKCGPMKMSKEEIKADLKKEWKPKFKKEKC
jgi:hypothetical protein